MKQDDARTLLEKVGGATFSVSPKGWLRCTCPFAPWLHASGKDSHPSFAVVTADDGLSSYKCYACGVKGPMATFVLRYERLSGRRYPELQSFVNRTNQESLEALERRLSETSYTRTPARARVPEPVREPAGEQAPAQGPSTQQEMFEPVVLPESMLDETEPLEGDVLKYVREVRKLEPWTILAWELRWNPKTNRIVIPVRNESLQLVAMSGRSFYDWQKPKYMHSKGFRRDFYLYGEHMLPAPFEEKSERKRTGYLVEGFFDVIKLWQYGYDNVLAVMGSYLATHQEAKLVRWFDSVVIVPDGDKPGYAASERIQAQLKKRMRCTIVPMPVGYDPDDLSPDMAKVLLGAPMRADDSAIAS